MSRLSKEHKQAPGFSNNQSQRSKAGARPGLFKEVSSSKGQLFVVAGAHQGNGEASRLVMNIIHEIYYADPSRDIDASLNQALRDAGRLVQELFNQQNTGRKHQINCACLVLTRQRVHFAQIGDNWTYRINRRDVQQLMPSNGNNDRHYHFQGRTQQSSDSEQDAKDTVKTNRSLPVHGGDCFVLSTTALNNITHQKIKKILFSNTPRQARQKLLDLLRKSGYQDSVDLEVIQTKSETAENSKIKAAPGKKLGWLAAIFLCLCSFLLLLDFIGNHPEKHLTATAKTDPDITAAFAPIFNPEKESAIDDEELQQRIDEALDLNFEQMDPTDEITPKTEHSTNKPKNKVAKGNQVESRRTPLASPNIKTTKPAASTSSKERFLRRWNAARLNPEDFSVVENEVTFLNTANTKKIFYYANLQNFIFSVRAETKGVGSKGRYGIIVGYQAVRGSPYEKFYLFSVLDQKEFLLQKYSNYKKELIAKIPLSNYSFSNPNSLQLKVKCEGKTLIVYTNHELLYVHSAPESIVGRVGLFADANLQITFSEPKFSKTMNLKNITNSYEKVSQN